MTITVGGHQYADRDLICGDCGRSFNFSAGEQEFFADKGYKNDPKRCRVCRKKRQTSREERQLERQSGEVGSVSPRLPRGPR